MENKIRNIAAKDFGYELVQPVSCCWYAKWNPKRKTKLQKWVEQYRRWKKLWSQNINFYSSGGCDAPDLENLKLVCIKSGEVDKYRDFCEMHDYQFREKDLGRIRDGSSLWCLTQEDGTVVSTGWLAYKSQFCIGEIDYSFQMTNSRTGILFDFNTKQEYRGNGYYGILLRSILANAQEPECFMIYTSPVNTASAKGIIKAGFHYDGTFCSRNGSAKRYLRAIGMHSLKRKIMFCGLYVRK